MPPPKDYSYKPKAHFAAYLPGKLANIGLGRDHARLTAKRQAPYRARFRQMEKQ